MTKKLERDEPSGKLKKLEKEPADVKQTEIHKKDVDRKTKKRILVIDDAEIDRMILEEILVQAGYEVMLASDGKEGMEIFPMQPFDLVITDMIMPEKLGIEVILELKEEFPEIKVIAISVGDEFGLELDLDMAKKLNVPTISKPFEPEDILKAVRKLLD